MPEVFAVARGVIAEGGPVPLAVVAVTVNVYSWWQSATRPENTAEVEDVQAMSPGHTWDTWGAAAWKRSELPLGAAVTR
jgi:hypothetical protein